MAAEMTRAFDISNPFCEWLNTPFILWQSKIKVALDFTLGLQPVFQLVARLPAAVLKNLKGMSANEIG